MRRGPRILLLVVLGVLALAAAALLLAVWATQQVPEFYRDALAAEPAAQAAAADQMDRQLTTIQGAAVGEGAWQVDFTADEINGWLAVKAGDDPELLARGLRAPRVRVRPGGITIACQAERAGLHSIVCLDVDVYMDSPGVVGLRIRKLRAGALPWPPARVLRGISEACRRAGLGVRWLQAGGDPVALISLGQIEGHHGKPIRIEQIRLDEDGIHISGVTGKGIRD
jgi:hypothetical protein